jgi:AcrR family transcriptional regulator
MSVKTSQNESTSPRRGRPRAFDRDAALRSAVRLFWEKGYDGTSLQDLQAAMEGIKAPSFYAAFGSKEKLFREALEQYYRERGNRTRLALETAPTARAAFEALLREAVETFSEPDTPHGCLIMSGTQICSSAGARERLDRLRRNTTSILRKRLERGVESGELADGADLDAVAAFYFTFLQGLAHRARDGASRRELEAAVSGALAAWDPLVSSRPTKPPVRTRRDR